VDAGPLIAGFDDTGVWHDECSRLLESLPGRCSCPRPSWPEVCYMIGPIFSAVRPKHIEAFHLLP
jgi:hypothetical protein